MGSTPQKKQLHDQMGILMLKKVNIMERRFKLCMKLEGITGEKVTRKPVPDYIDPDFKLMKLKKKNGLGDEETNDKRDDHLNRMNNGILGGNVGDNSKMGNDLPEVNAGVYSQLNNGFFGGNVEVDNNNANVVNQEEGSDKAAKKRKKKKDKKGKGDNEQTEGQVNTDNITSSQFNQTPIDNRANQVNPNNSSNNLVNYNYMKIVNPQIQNAQNIQNGQIDRVNAINESNLNKRNSYIDNTSSLRRFQSSYVNGNPNSPYDDIAYQNNYINNNNPNQQRNIRNTRNNNQRNTLSHSYSIDQRSSYNHPRQNHPNYNQYNNNQHKLNYSPYSNNNGSRSTINNTPQYHFSNRTPIGHGNGYNNPNGQRYPPNRHVSHRKPPMNYQYNPSLNRYGDNSGRRDRQQKLTLLNDPDMLEERTRHGRNKYNYDLDANDSRYNYEEHSRNRRKSPHYHKPMSSFSQDHPPSNHHRNDYKRPLQFNLNDFDDSSSDEDSFEEEFIYNY